VRTRKREPAPADGEHIERRRQPRDPQAPANWEQIVLQRMAARVRSLSGTPTSDADATEQGGWEAAGLRTLQRRVQELDSKK